MSVITSLQNRFFHMVDLLLGWRSSLPDKSKWEFCYKPVDLDGPFYDTDKIILQPGEQATSSRYDAWNGFNTWRTQVFCKLSDFQWGACFEGDRDDDDSLIAVIPVGKKPQEFSVSKQDPTCLWPALLEDSNGIQEKGSVYVINYLTNQIVKRFIQAISHMDCGWWWPWLRLCCQPELWYKWTSTTSCIRNAGGRNGYLTVIDMSTLELYQKNLMEVHLSTNELLSCILWVTEIMRPTWTSGDFYLTMNVCYVIGWFDSFFSLW